MIRDLATALFATLAIALGIVLGEWSRRAAARWSVRKLTRVGGAYELQSQPVYVESGELAWIVVWAPRAFWAEQIWVWAEGKAVAVEALKLDDEPLRLGKLTGDEESSLPCAVPAGARLRLCVHNRTRTGALVSLRVEGRITAAEAQSLVAGVSP